MHTDVSSIEYIPQKNVTVAMTVLFSVFLAVGSVLPLVLMYLGVYMWCIFPEFEYIKRIQLWM